MGTNKNSKNILISHDITFEERRRLERERKRENENEKLERILKKREKKWEWISPLTRKTKRVNKNGKISQKIWVD